MDHFLIAKAEGRAGMDIHDIAPLLQIYMLLCEVGEPTLEQQARKELLESYIRRYVNTGKYDDSWRTAVPNIIESCKV